MPNVTRKRANTSPTVSSAPAASFRSRVPAWLPLTACTGASCSTDDANFGTVRIGRTFGMQLVSPGDSCAMKRRRIRCTQ